MMYWDVYERKGVETLELIQTINAPTPEEAVAHWERAWGDNYGKVIILPVTSSSRHRAFKEG